MSAARAEEAEGRLDHLLAAAVSRSRWFSGRLAGTAGALVLSGAAAGIFVWIGTFTQGSGLSFPIVLEAGLNTVPPAIFLLGVGGLAIGLRPRLAAAAVYLVLGWSALVELVGGFLTQNRWMLDTSVFHQMAAAPAVAPDWQTNSVLTCLRLAAGVHASTVSPSRPSGPGRQVRMDGTLATVVPRRRGLPS